ncbi:hypothetical protein CVT26_006270 [Gymnopilus dilepis]|uniref:Uncharacterized protein n=1 Tax=Gymnopilus dilepis TaxID=231916 RepID=A0A409Y1B4_9AGAR|nr:hypothetical protein CVT26_006270 [Gymnopilus dilepis]
MGECTGPTLAAGVHGQFHGGSLAILDTMFSALLKIPAVFVCVYDGINRPDKKRGVTVIKRALYCEEPSKELVRAYGYHVHEASGEAEAELAILNVYGFLDGVITMER